MYIYTIKVNDEIRYVGKTVEKLSTRLNQHKRNARLGVKTPLCDLLRKYINTGKIEIDILEVVDNTNWKEREIFYIKKFRDDGYRLVNITDGGDGTRLVGDQNGMHGRSHTPESIDKMKANRSGISPWNKGVSGYKILNKVNPEGKARGTEHHNSKLDDDKVREIIKLREGGMSFQKIANLYGISKPSVMSIINGKTWKHVKKFDQI